MRSRNDLYKSINEFPCGVFKRVLEKLKTFRKKRDMGVEKYRKNQKKSKRGHGYSVKAKKTTLYLVENF